MWPSDFVITLLCSAGHENVSVHKFCTTCGVPLPPPLNQELFEKLSNLPHHVQLAVFAWFINDIHVDDMCTLYAWFNYEPLGERKRSRVH